MEVAILLVQQKRSVRLLINVGRLKDLEPVAGGYGAEPAVGREVAGRDLTMEIEVGNDDELLKVNDESVAVAVDDQQSLDVRRQHEAFDRTSRLERQRARHISLQVEHVDLVANRAQEYLLVVLGRRALHIELDVASRVDYSAQI